MRINWDFFKDIKKASQNKKLKKYLSVGLDDLKEDFNKVLLNSLLNGDQIDVTKYGLVNYLNPENPFIEEELYIVSNDPDFEHQAEFYPNDSAKNKFFVSVYIKVNNEKIYFNTEMLNEIEDKCNNLEKYFLINLEKF